jgi:hypothetical protein
MSGQVSTGYMHQPSSDLGFWVRHGWKFLLGLVVVIGLVGVSDLARGLDADPAILESVAGLTPDEIRESSSPLAMLADIQVRSGGIYLILVSALWAVITLIPYRRGERWAWWTMWTFPVWTLLIAVMFLFIELQPHAPPPPSAVSGWVFFGLTSLLLIGSRRGFRTSS